MINRLKNLRKDILKLSQEEFAKKLDISRANMSSIEIGRVALTERNIKAICQTFNVNEDWLCNGNEPIFIEKETDALEEFFNEKNASPLARKIIKKYFNLNEKHRELFENFLKECINELEEEYKTEKENDKIKEFPKQEQKEMVKIIARGEGITEISKEELDEIKRNSRELTSEEVKNLLD